jgi:glycosyltransferase involved in cell wall biosynthesis
MPRPRIWCDAIVRLLFVSNYFPPFGFGGYEEMCRELAEGLRARGHDVLVLTSRHGGSPASGGDDWVRRRLHLQMLHRPLVNGLRSFAAPLLESRNRSIVRNTLRQCAPNVVVVWGMWNLGVSLASYIEEQSRGRAVFYLADYWPTLPSQVRTYWKSDARSAIARPLKRALAAFGEGLLPTEERPKLSAAIFPSRFMREALQREYVPTEDWHVIAGIADLRRFLAIPVSRRAAHPGGRCELAFVGRVSPEKGVDTAIRALGSLRSRAAGEEVRLTIAGQGQADYIDGLRSLARDVGVEDRVRFVGRLGKDALVDLYTATDIFLFPSSWEEPFGRVLIEAMAAGVAVVGTATGGAAEILEHGRTALVHRPDDASGMADAIEALTADEGLRHRLAVAAREEALSRWNLDAAVIEIEQVLRAIAERVDSKEA